MQEDGARGKKDKSARIRRVQSVEEHGIGRTRLQEGSEVESQRIMNHQSSRDADRNKHRHRRGEKKQAWSEISSKLRRQLEPLRGSNGDSDRRAYGHPNAHSDSGGRIKESFPLT